MDKKVVIIYSVSLSTKFLSKLSRSFFTLLIFAGLVTLYNSKDLLAKVYEKHLFFSNCDEPIIYSIGKIDQEFDITKQSLLKKTEAAANLWNKEYKTPILQYSDSASLKVSLKYDERQRYAISIRKAKAELDNKISELDSQLDAYNAEYTSLEDRINALNSEIESWNKKGGAPKDIYDDLNSMQKTLSSEISRINNLATQLNLQSANYNKQVNKLNEDIKSFNGLLLTDPEEGLYDPNDQTITIFIYDDEEKFIHTLAHEFGHALSLDHNEDADSIMYKLSTDSTKLSSKDKADLQNYCKEQSKIDIVLTELENISGIQLTSLKNIDTISGHFRQ